MGDNFPLPLPLFCSTAFRKKSSVQAGSQFRFKIKKQILKSRKWFKKNAALQNVKQHIKFKLNLESKIRSYEQESAVHPKLRYISRINKLIVIIQRLQIFVWINIEYVIRAQS